MLVGREARLDIRTADAGSRVTRYGSPAPARPRRAGAASGARTREDLFLHDEGMAFMSFDSDHARVVESFTESASNQRDLSRAPSRAAKPPRKSLLLSSLESVTNHVTAR